MEVMEEVCSAGDQRGGTDGFEFVRVKNDRGAGHKQATTRRVPRPLHTNTSYCTDQDGPYGF
jgi:hypothetical protein